jgi:carbonic anhydrase/acetyltransferase-like protein (isoleucine patch superfamily)
MPSYSFENLSPNVHPTAFVAATATIVGDVIVEAGASIWYGAVIRADVAPVVVRAGANVQDGAVIIGAEGLTTDIGNGATIGPNCVVQGAMIGNDAVIANGSVVLHAARVGAGALVAGGSVVGANTEIPAGYIASGSPAQVRRPVAGSGAQTWVDSSADAYQDLSQRHRTGVREI